MSEPAMRIRLEPRSLMGVTGCDFLAYKTTKREAVYLL